MSLAPPFPYFGGKRRAAADVWRLLGRVDRYVEPFFGSGAVLLGSPHRPKSELINDRCGFIANVWRAIQQDPATVERWVSAPCDEIELKAVHKWLRGEGAERIEAVDWEDLSACDAEVAGRWLWVSCVSMSSPDYRTADSRRGSHGCGLKSLRPPSLSAISKRFERVQILRGDWSRCVTSAALCLAPGRSRPRDWARGVFFDPPYGVGNGVTYDDKTGDVARDVWEWALECGERPELRIVVAGYEDGRTVPDGWQTIERVEKRGYAGSDNGNRHLERLWASPACIGATQLGLFAV